jgi:nucleotide-binding universal stress UspA family protein
MKTILGLIGGGDRDAVILRTALAAATPLSAHLNFLHIRVSPGIAARYDGPVQFAMGAAVRDAFDELSTKAEKFSKVAADHVREFCAVSKIEIRDAPTNAKKVTASFREENDTTIERLILHARQSDLVVLGRAKQTQGLSPDTLEILVKNCGRPVVVAATVAPRTLTGTVMVCWNKSENVARAVAAATPILTIANRVVFTSIVKRNEDDIDGVHDLVRRFAQNGVSAEAQVIPVNDGGIPTSLVAAAGDCGADLVVMGAYGHSQLRELIFGSCTEVLLRDIDRPIFLMH